MTTSSSPPRASRRGFTLVELLVVIGIILLLIGILTPMVGRAYHQAVRSTMAADLQVVARAVEDYKRDFGDYPRPSANPRVIGAAVLCWALIAPGPASEDGYGDPTGQQSTIPGPGFRVRPQGQVYGPYVPLDHLKIGMVDKDGNIQPSSGPPIDSRNVIGDRYGHPILYFVANHGPSANSPNGFISSYGVGMLPAQSIFNYGDNLNFPNSTFNVGTTSPNQLTLKVMRWRLGDTNNNGMIDASSSTHETPATTGPFILWSDGPDGLFGTDDDVACDGSTLQLNGPLPGGFTP